MSETEKRMRRIADVLGLVEHAGALRLGIASASLARVDLESSVTRSSLAQERCLERKALAAQCANDRQAAGAVALKMRERDQRLGTRRLQCDAERAECLEVYRVAQRRAQQMLCIVEAQSVDAASREQRRVQAQADDRFGSRQRGLRKSA